MFARHAAVTRPSRLPRPHHPWGVRPRQRKNRRPLCLEQCEPRQLLAVFTVTSSLDTGAVGELRWAVNSANSNPGPDVIDFSVPQVQLSLGELSVTGPVTIDGSSALPVLVQIAASPNSRIFNVDDGNPNTQVPVTMKQLELLSGDVSVFPVVGTGGAILNRERLDVENSLIRDNRASLGGGIANHGRLSLQGTDVVNNVATGGGGGGIWNAPGALSELDGAGIRSNRAPIGNGGGILNDASMLTLAGDASAFSDNTAANSGGGIAIVHGGGAVLQGGAVTSNNGSVGGGISVDGAGSSLVAGPAVDIQSNSAAEGGGIAVTNQAAAPTCVAHLSSGIWHGRTAAESSC